ncbi:LysR substrate-binding domain-containing protein [Sulfitobacter donghicola]|uniref:LysR family transcriptional regulator n=1 Tax=Sulfitobacter donghicola DSW-25 = KCTC 12864 = JCM 14565 TaxID=1300350 RepID=A0A073IRR3_9RHOB|nr:LysR substrate-binding domain-containing protein [Sulfitobacter donghicola]KEJ88072.1 LysR family transcriptional regulator [Sulfitobacter donghicola DSW-25 = KCTC 12864 = JCM 14565]KIN68709.1 Transcriptional regulator, LysR family protein [Sulfitobacter donghicola DSW-25 = KCTC 12864 = JCM 14565]
MIAPRRYFPSISALLAFEACARLESATQAAIELSLTQSAVSRQIKSLENQLGVQLMSRQGRQLVLTHAGAEYVREVREILRRLAQATINTKTESQSGALALAILPAFGMHWLAPRLSLFAAAHPEVTVNLSTRLQPFTLGASPFDAAIHFGHEDWPGVRYLPLMPEVVVPVCAPDLIGAPFHAPTDLLQHPLLHLETRPRAWSRWFGAVGHPCNPPHGMVFDQFATMAQAALHGLGIALLPTFVADPYLKNGQLVLASDKTTESIGSYYLVWPDDRPAPPPLTAFCDWIEGQTEQQKC